MPDHNSDHNPAIPHTRTPILVSAMRLLAQEIQSEDGVANAAIAEAADRMEELARQVEQAQHYAPTTIVSVQDQLDGANAAILDLTDQLLKANTRVAELEEGISTAMQLIEGGFDSAAYEALEALNAHK